MVAVDRWVPGVVQPIHSSARGATSTPAERAQWLAAHLGRADLVPLSPEDLVGVADHVEERRFAGGTVVFGRADMPDHVYILRSGAVELSRSLGGRRVMLKLLRPGDPFGDVPLLLRECEPFDAVAIEDSVVLSIESLALYQLLSRHPALAMRWLVSVADRMRETQERVSDLLAGSLEGQIASFLLHQPGGEARLSQQNVARLLGARRTSVNQALRRLEERGLVRTSYRLVAVTDAEGLGELVDME